MRFLLGPLENIILHLVFSSCLLFLNTKDGEGNGRIKMKKKQQRIESLV